MNDNTVYLADILELSKARIVLLSLLMATLGYFLADPGPIDVVRFLGMLIGTGLVGAAACSINQYAEKDIDSRMWRTMNRPLPAGRIKPKYALLLGWGCGIFGEIILMVAVNPMTAILGALTILTYLGMYTPSKRVSPVSTLVGAIPGALPPLIGWTAGYGRVSLEGLILFGILFLWQIPHFLAIGWLYREDYRRADLPILPVMDQMGTTTAKHAVLYSIALLPLALVPSMWGMTGTVYLVGATLLGLIYLAFSARMAFHLSRATARGLFFVSIIYLPALSVLMLWDRVHQ